MNIIGTWGTWAARQEILKRSADLISYLRMSTDVRHKFILISWTLIPSLLSSLLGILGSTILLFYVFYLHPRKSQSKILSIYVLLSIVSIMIVSLRGLFNFSARASYSYRGESYEATINIGIPKGSELSFAIQIILSCMYIVVLFLINVQNSRFKTFLTLASGLSIIYTGISYYESWKSLTLKMPIPAIHYFCRPDIVFVLFLSLFYNMVFIIYLYRNVFPFCLDYLYVTNDLKNQLKTLAREKKKGFIDDAEYKRRRSSLFMSNEIIE